MVGGHHELVEGDGILGPKGVYLLLFFRIGHPYRAGVQTLGLDHKGVGSLMESAVEDVVQEGRVVRFLLGYLFFGVHEAPCYTKIRIYGKPELIVFLKTALLGPAAWRLSRNTLANSNDRNM